MTNPRLLETKATERIVRALASSRALVPAALIVLTACSAIKSGGGAAESATPAGSSVIPTADLAQCESMVREDLADDTGRSYRHYAPQFGSQIQRAYDSVDEFDISLLNADHRYKTQDGKPEIRSIGPAIPAEARIKVPVVMQWPGSAPYTVTWIFERAGGKWQIIDLTTTGHSNDNGSLLASLKVLLNKRH